MQLSPMMLTPSSLEVFQSYERQYSDYLCALAQFNRLSFSWKSKDENAVTTYNMTDIKHDVSTRMTRDGIILFGLLSGADYDKVCAFIYYPSFYHISISELGPTGMWHTLMPCCCNHGPRKFL
jgi:hypothetical protein